jgi:DDE_Tnp_1-associated
MLLDFLKEIPDDRDREGRVYDLPHILLFTILAILSNAKNYKDVSRFISIHFESLKEVYGIKWPQAPDYTTVRNILIGVMQDKLEETFRKCARLLSNSPLKGKHICFDGKTLRGSFQNLKNQKAIQLFEIFSTCDNIVLGHIPIVEKEHEIPLMQELFASLPLAGSIVTLDALHCQKKHLRQQEMQEPHSLHK